MTIKVGIGYDVHCLVKGRALILGGIKVPFAKGLKGHSDADVLTHAIMDALLGALGQGDIGEHFPDTDPQYKDACSLDLLKRVNADVRKQGYVINNIDTIVITDAPNLKAYKDSIRRSIAACLEIPADRVNVKAKTTEGLGHGNGKTRAISAFATACLTQ